MGQRVRAVMSELHGEKIDIIDWSDDPAQFVGNALSPAKALRVEVVDLANRAARVTVPDFQLSLAIGREGQNARLAARLTGWRIDIRSGHRAPVESELITAAPSRAARSQGSIGVDFSVVRRAWPDAHLCGLPAACAGHRVCCGSSRSATRGSRSLRPDPARRLPGRGAHLHPDPACFALAVSGAAPSGVRCASPVSSTSAELAEHVKASDHYARSVRPGGCRTAR